MTVIEAEDLRRRFGRREVLRDCSFALPDGRFVASYCRDHQIIKHVDEMVVLLEIAADIGEHALYYVQALHVDHDFSYCLIRLGFRISFLFGLLSLLLGDNNSVIIIWL